MNELRKLWHIMDENDITIRPRYIQSAANIWADRLSRELDDADWRLHPRLFRQLDKQYQHTIDRFASTLLYSYSYKVGTGRITGDLPCLQARDCDYKRVTTYALNVDKLAHCIIYLHKS